MENEVESYIKKYNLKENSKSKTFLEGFDLSKLKRVETKEEKERKLSQLMFDSKIKNREFFSYLDYYKITKIVETILDFYKRGYRIEGTKVFFDFRKSEMSATYVRIK